MSFDCETQVLIFQPQKHVIDIPNSGWNDFSYNITDRRPQIKIGVPELKSQQDLRYIIT